MALWAKAIRSADDTRTRPLMTGRISLYRSLSAIPDAYDIVQVWMPPDILEPDDVSSNVQALAMGRALGKFKVLPVFRLPLPPSPLYTNNALGRWIGIAALHGACGFGIEDAERFGQSHLPAQQVRARLRSIVAAVRPEDFGVQPQGTIAILWEPYAQGFAAGQQKVPAYGFIPGFSDGEPSRLFATFRLGTVFGTVDVLQLEELPAADLDRYGVIFAPLALKLTAPAISALKGYIERGGILVYDLGAGAYNSGRWDALPYPLSRWCGVEGFLDIKDRAGHLSFNRIPPLFPSLVPGMRTTGVSEQPNPRQGGITITGGNWSVLGPTAHVLISEDTVPVAVIDVIREQRPTGPKKQRARKPLRPGWAGILFRPQGLGAAVFATYRLWSNWNPADPAYLAFHHDLCMQRARYELIGPPLFPLAVHIAGVDEDRFRLYNTAGATVATVMSYCAHHRPYLGVPCGFSAAWRLDNGLRSGYARVTVPLQAGQLRTLRAVPLLVEPYQGEALALVERYDEHAIVLQLAGAGSTLRAAGEGPPGLAPGVETRIRLTVKDGDYPVKGDSRQLVQFQWPDGRVVSRIFQVTSDGRFRFDVQARKVRIIIMPAPE